MPQSTRIFSFSVVMLKQEPVTCLAAPNNSISIFLIIITQTTIKTHRYSYNPAFINTQDIFLL
jgi:hypothetical protein